MRMLLLKILIPTIFFIVFLIPGYTYFIVNSDETSLLFSSNLDSTSKAYILFRLFGLYAFTLIWSQTILGPFMNPLRRLYGAVVLKIHRVEGVFAFTFAILHPLLFYTAYLSSPNNRGVLFALEDYLGKNLLIYGMLGQLALFLMACTVISALLARYIRVWRTIHFLNYLIFILVFVHSFKIGSDVRTELLQSLYLFFAITFLLAFSYRVLYKRLFFRLKNSSNSLNQVSNE